MIFSSHFPGTHSFCNSFTFVFFWSAVLKKSIFNKQVGWPYYEICAQTQRLYIVPHRSSLCCSSGVICSHVPFPFQYFWRGYGWLSVPLCCYWFTDLTIKFHYMVIDFSSTLKFQLLFEYELVSSLVCSSFRNVSSEIISNTFRLFSDKMEWSAERRDEHDYWTWLWLKKWTENLLFIVSVGKFCWMSVFVQYSILVSNWLGCEHVCTTPEKIYWGGREQSKLIATFFYNHRSFFSSSFYFFQTLLQYNIAWHITLKHLVIGIWLNNQSWPFLRGWRKMIYNNEKAGWTNNPLELHNSILQKILTQPFY